MGRVLALLLVLGLALGWTTSVADAAETLCINPPAGMTCNCSEPLQAPSYTQTGGFYYNPSDSTTNQCSQDGVANAAIVHASAIIASTDSAAMAALPAGHAVARFMRPSSSNHSGAFGLGHDASAPGSAVRLAARWYIYHSPNFIFKGDTDLGGAGQCNSKATELWPPQVGQSGGVFDYTAGFHFYNSNLWVPGVDCCVSGGPDGFTSQELRGVWKRYEAVIGPRSGVGTRLQLFVKNVTTGTPERMVIDTYTNQGGAIGTNKAPPQPFTAIVSNNFRADNGASPCNGWLGLMYYIAVSWTTNAGQRIGAATEVESGGGPVLNHSTLLSTAGTYGLTGADANLTHILGPAQVGFIHTALLVVIIVAALAIGGGKVRR